MSELLPGQFEIIIAYYGVQDGISMHSRRSTESIVNYAKGRYVTANGYIYTSSHDIGVVGCVIRTEFEDDTPDGTKGRVIAICEPVRQPTKGGQNEQFTSIA